MPPCPSREFGEDVFKSSYCSTVSSSLGAKHEIPIARDATWRNSKIIGPYDPDTVRRLKDEVDGDLYTSGSATLVRAMLADGLVDELHLLVYPVTRGPGPRLFPRKPRPSSLRSRPVIRSTNEVVYLNYGPEA